MLFSHRIMSNPSDRMSVIIIQRLSFFRATKQKIQTLSMYRCYTSVYKYYNKFSYSQSSTHRITLHFLLNSPGNLFYLQLASITSLAYLHLDISVRNWVGYEMTAVNLCFNNYCNDFLKASASAAVKKIH